MKFNKVNLEGEGEEEQIHTKANSSSLFCDGFFGGLKNKSESEFLRQNNDMDNEWEC